MDFFIYLFCLGVGLVFTLLTAFFGHHGAMGGHDAHVGGSGGHAEAGGDASDMPGVSIFSPTVMATFVTAFGGFGVIFHEIPATRSVLLSAPLAAVLALITAGTVLTLLKQLFKVTQGSSEGRVGSLEGVVGNIITPIPQNGVGEIAYVQKGSRYTAPAREANGAPVPTGAAVKIVRIVGSQFYVKAV